MKIIATLALIAAAATAHAQTTQTAATCKSLESSKNVSHEQAQVCHDIARQQYEKAMSETSPAATQAAASMTHWSNVLDNTTSSESQPVHPPSFGPVVSVKRVPTVLSAECSPYVGESYKKLIATCGQPSDINSTSIRGHESTQYVFSDSDGVGHYFVYFDDSSRVRAVQSHW